MSDSRVSEILEAARLSAAAYVDDQAARERAVAELGLAVVDTYENEDHRALFCAAAAAAGGARYVLVLCGTRFSDGNLHELFDDEDVLPVELGLGVKVMAGFHGGMAELYKWALDRLPAIAPLEICGHSLGGARAHLAPVFLDPARISRITTFGAPKAANRAYWSTRSSPVLRRVVNRRDIWAGYPWLPPWTQPQGLLWLNGGRIQPIDEGDWPGGLKPADHAIEEGYVAGLAAIAAAASSAA